MIMKLFGILFGLKMQFCLIVNALDFQILIID